ncbi:MAG: hypothetical protein WC586_13350 [Methanoregula sp.]
MNAKEAQVTAAILVCGAILNYGYPVVARAVSLPSGIEFVIVAYCLIVLLVPLRIGEVVAIGIFSGVLNILTSPVHVATILGGQSFSAAGFMAFFNLISEPVGIIVCFIAFTYLAGKLRFTSPLVASFIATFASGLAYLLLVFLFNPALPATQPEFLGSFLNRVAMAAVVNAVLVQLIFMAVKRPMKAFLAGPVPGNAGNKREG